MIRKPAAEDFRETAAVTALRDAGVVAMEGSRGIVQGTAQFFGRAVMLMFGFGFVMSLIIHLGAVGVVFAVPGVFTVFFLRRRKREVADETRWASAPIRARDGSRIEPGRYELSVGAVSRGAAMIAVPAILFFPTTARLTYMLPFAVAGTVYLGLAMLILTRLVGDRTVVLYDVDTLTVNGLLGKATILWEDVADVAVRKVSFLNLKVLFASGARRNLVVLGRRNRLGGVETLYIPIDLIGLDAIALGKLVTSFLALSTTMAPADTAPEHGFSLGESGPKHAGSFDPDAIMARYMAERTTLTANSPMVQVQQRPVFGRKTA